MVMDDHGKLALGALAAKLEEVVVRRKIDLICLDPFVKTHAVGENTNDAIDKVIEVLTDLAHKYNIAIDAPHHVSKGQAEPGNAQKGRGASAFVDAGRLVYTLSPMSAEEAKAFGIPEAERRCYVRMDKAKVNITPPAPTRNGSSSSGCPSAMAPSCIRTAITCRRSNPGRRPIPGQTLMPTFRTGFLTKSTPDCRAGCPLQ